MRGRRSVTGEVRRRKRLLLGALAFAKKRREAAQVTAAVAALAAVTATGIAGKALSDASALRERLAVLEVAAGTAVSPPAPTTPDSVLVALQADVASLRVRCDLTARELTEGSRVGAENLASVTSEVMTLAERLVVLAPPIPPEALDALRAELAGLRSALDGLRSVSAPTPVLVEQLAGAVAGVAKAEARLDDLDAEVGTIGDRVTVLEELVNHQGEALLDLEARLRVEP